SGAVTARGSAAGTEGDIALSFVASMPSGSLTSRRLANGELAFEGRLTDGDLGGMLTASAMLDGHLGSLSAGLEASDEQVRLSALEFAIAGTRATGNLLRGPAGLLTGELAIAAPDLSLAAALFLQEAEGALDARLSLSPSEG